MSSQPSGYLSSGEEGDRLSIHCRMGMGVGGVVGKDGDREEEGEGER